MIKTAIVTGGTSGIGAACAKFLSKSGYRVYTISRNIRENETNIISLECDVTDSEKIKKTFNEIWMTENRIDLLVNCAGFGISGALEFTSADDSHRQIEVNLFGIDNTCRAVVPIMRQQGFGRIINISSVAAVIAIPFQAWYSISKAGINAYTLALSNEVRPFGISVCAVMPGDVKTGFTNARTKEHKGDDIYGGMISRSVSHMENDEQNGMSPYVIAKRILKVSKKKHIKPFYSAGIIYKCICVLAKILPGNLVNHLVYNLYCK